MLRVVFLCFLVALAACDKKGSYDSTKERAKAEEEAGREVDYKNQAQKALKMEADLADRHYFYNAIEGEYEGTLLVANESYRIKFTFVRSLPPYTGQRIRELSEIENDLNNLYFHLHVVQWHPDDQASAVGCPPMSGIRPNLVDGSQFVASSNCPNFYTIFIADSETNAFSDNAEKAKTLAKKITDKDVSEINFLVGTIQPSSNAVKYTFNVKRIR